MSNIFDNINNVKTNATKFEIELLNRKKIKINRDGGDKYQNIYRKWDQGHTDRTQSSEGSTLFPSTTLPDRTGPATPPQDIEMTSEHTQVPNTPGPATPTDPITINLPTADIMGNGVTQTGPLTTGQHAGAPIPSSSVINFTFLDANRKPLRVHKYTPHSSSNQHPRSPVPPLSPNSTDLIPSIFTEH